MIPAHTMSSLDEAFLGVEGYGEARLRDDVRRAIADHNAAVRESVADLCGWTTNRLMTARDVDRATVGFPLKLFQMTWGYRRDDVLGSPIGELVELLHAKLGADWSMVTGEIRRAVFGGVSYSFDGLPVMAFLSGDGWPIPHSPSGMYFASDHHSHYLAAETLEPRDVSALIETVAEHRDHAEAARLVLAIPARLESSLAQMDRHFFPSCDLDAGRFARLSGLPDSGRKIGEFDGVDVWVKPWVPSGYLACYLPDGGACMIRERSEGSGDFRVTLKDDAQPFGPGVGGREFGVGVLDRTKAAVLCTGSATYKAPPIY